MKYRVTLGIAAFSALIVTSCGTENNTLPGNDGNVPGNDGNVAYQTAELSTGSTGNPTWAYFNFDEGKEVAETEEWHIALSRMEVKVSDTVRSAIGDKKENFYPGGKPDDSAFMNIDETVEVQAFYNVTSVKDEDFVKQGTKSAIDTSWYNYQHAEPMPIITPNKDNYWYIKSATEDSFAKMHASSITEQYVATFSFYIQAVGEDSYADQPVSINIPLATPNTVCFDIDLADTVACNTTTWDVQFVIEQRSYQIKLNGGVSGNGKAAAYGPVGGADYTSGTDEGLRYAYITDVENDAFSHYSPWQYGINNTHEIWPNYRTYIIDLGEDKALIKLQFTGYYGVDQASRSGTINMRYMDLTDKGE